MYRLCSDPLPSNSQTINYNSISCGVGNTMTLPLDTFYEISGIENSFYAQSSCNGGTHLGMQVFLYHDTLTFPQTCTDWVLDWTGCCRSSSITNLSTTGSPIYVEAGINSFGNYSLSSYIVSDYYCAGDSMRTKRFYRNFMSDTDSSLVRLTCPKQGANNCVSYVAGLSTAQPFFTYANDPVQLNSNGALDFRTQPGLSQIASIGMTVYEMNNNDTVGYSMHDIPIVILDSLCNQPVEILSVTSLLGGYDVVNNIIHFCSNNSSIFNVILFDSDGDTIQLDPSRTNITQIFGPAAVLFLNTNPPFRPDSAQLSIQIVPPPYIWGTNYCRNPVTIGIVSQGGNSPLVSSTILEFGCEVYAIIATASHIVCPNTSQQIQLTSGFLQPANIQGTGWYQWTQISGPPVLFSNDTIPNPVLTVPAHSPTSTPILLEVQHFSAIDSVTSSACTSSSKQIPILTTGLENGTYFISLFIDGTIVNQTFQVLD